MPPEHARCSKHKGFYLRRGINPFSEIKKRNIDPRSGVRASVGDRAGPRASVGDQAGPRASVGDQAGPWHRATGTRPHRAQLQPSPLAVRASARSLRTSPSPRQKRSSAAHPCAAHPCAAHPWRALSFTRHGCSRAPHRCFPSRVNPPAAAGSGHGRFWAGTQRAHPRGQTLVPTLLGRNLECSQTAASELWHEPPCHLGVPQVQREADHRLPRLRHVPAFAARPAVVHPHFSNHVRQQQQQQL